MRLVRCSEYPTPPCSKRAEGLAVSTLCALKYAPHPLGHVVSPRKA